MMSRRKQALFYGLMALLTLAVIEGMAQAAYYIAFGEFNGGGPSRPATAGGAADELAAREEPGPMLHPYYGYYVRGRANPLNQLPPRREDGVVLIGLLGGSVATDVAPAFQSALDAWFRDNDLPLRPVVLNLAWSGIKQPQQVMKIANTLSIGGEYDIVVNLDGRNELVLAHENYFNHGLFPFYPFWWQNALSERPTDTQKLLAGRIYALRQREQRLDALAAAAPWRWSALYGIVNRYLRERAAAQILTLNYELAQVPPDEYRQQRYGPELATAFDGYELSRSAVRVWYRGSVILHDLSRTAGAEYYHLLQPNQYLPDSKPLTDQELAVAYDPEKLDVQAYRDGYPLFRRLGAELREQGINYHDLTQIFADRRETLYVDRCCHLNARGNELLAASMVQRLAPALRNRAALAGVKVAGSASAGNALYPAAEELSPVHAVNKLYFDVARGDDDGTLRYARDNCRPADTAAPFFVQITPVDAADLMPGAAEFGYNRAEFSFDRDGGVTDAAGRCVVEYQLPEYDIANVLTGQYHPETGQLLWRSRITFDFGFAVERTAAGALRYARDRCLPVHLATRFFLHITPTDAADLHPGRAEHGYNNDDFPGLSPAAGAIDAAGRCVVERALPDYDVASIGTGQYIPGGGGRLWETRLDFEQP